MISLVMEKDPNQKMEFRLEIMGLLVLLTAASSVALSREEFTEAVVRKAEMLKFLLELLIRVVGERVVVDELRCGAAYNTNQPFTRIISMLSWK